MIRRAMSRRISAVEKRLGVSGEPWAAMSDLDLLKAIQLVAELWAKQGHVGAAAALAAHDAEEAKLRAYSERPDVARYGQLALEDGVRWPYQRARARQWEEHPGYDGPRSAQSDEELVRKIKAGMVAMKKQL